MSGTEQHDDKPMASRDDYDDRDSRPVPRRRRSPSRSRTPERDRDRTPPPPRRRSRSRERERERDRDRDRSRSPRRRSRSRTRSPARRMDTDRDDRDSRRDDRRGGDDRRRGGDDRFARRPVPPPRAFDPAAKAMSREIAANEAAKRSKKECRVYVGNLAFAVKWNDLKDFMREAGNVVFAEIMLLPNGMSKGCGVVEFSTPDEAQKAIRDLNEQTLLGRPLFIREDREDEARYGSAAIAGRAGYMGPGAAGVGVGGGRGGYGGGGRGGFAGGAGGVVPGQAKGLYIQGIPFNVGWQDLKDLFRAAGNIVRADVKMGPDGSPTGTGTVMFETAQDAQNAIAMYNGFEFQGNILEVREDRFPHPASFGGGRGGFGGGRGGYMGGGGGRGGFAGGYAGGGFDAYGGAAAGGFGAGAFAGLPFAPRGFQGGFGATHAPVAPSTQIYVRNLPWSTANEDLVELFQTTGTVEEAEMLFEGGRSKGAGVVQFASVEEAETAIAKFQSYSYGGRPLQLEFNARWKDFGNGGNAGPYAGLPTGPAAMTGGGGAVTGADEYDAAPVADAAGDAEMQA